jgi:hypothetical protein
MLFLPKPDQASLVGADKEVAAAAPDEATSVALLS